ncbi:peptide N-acetyl-beta-D-glucosaminyl asparaginase amidase A-domain-containing protein [Melampsora americana]|nr:peptide N-acetyl-beta-D-glucosaminyl asparaginase amidase A-domain-containing protein [Melampsora americana]
MTRDSLFIFILAVHFFIGEVISSHMHLKSRQAQHRPNALSNFEVMAPPVVPKGDKFCEVKLIEHTFGNSYGKPATINFVPPTDCGPAGSWASVVFNLTATSRGKQYDRLAQLFLNEVEIWRTSTPEPTHKGIIWTVTRDMSRYMPLLAKSNPLTLVLNNIIDPNLKLDGEYEVTLSARFYLPTTNFPAAEQLGEISTVGHEEGYRIEKQLTFPKVIARLTLSHVPSNTATAFVEIFASGSEKEEYNNVPDEILPRLDPNNTGAFYGTGSFREVQLLIDDKLAGVAYPFPVIYTGGILLSWWRPITAIGALNAPSYTMDITPFVPLLTDEQNHNFTILIEGQGNGNTSTNPKWILSGSVGITLDPSGTRTTGKLESVQSTPYLKTIPLSDDEQGRIRFKTEASRQLELKATVVTGTNGQQSVTVTQDFKFSNIPNSSDKWNIFEGLTESVHNGEKQLHDEFSYPLNLTMSQTTSDQNGTVVSGHLSHGYTRTEDHVYPAGSKSKVDTQQNSEGDLILDGDGRAISGIGRTSQKYKFKNEGGEDYSRDIEIFNITQVIRNRISGTLAPPSSQLDVSQLYQIQLPETALDRLDDVDRVISDFFDYSYLGSPVRLINSGNPGDTLP